MTTFIDFRYSRALAAALFAGQEKEETRIELDLAHDNFFVLSVHAEHAGLLATIGDSHNAIASIVNHEGVLIIRDSHDTSIATVELKRGSETLVGIRLSSSIVGVRLDDTIEEASWNGPEGVLALDIHMASTRVMGQGTGRVARWGELFYRRNRPGGLCVQLTMDWHHLRAGIPLFGTMTAEHLIEEGRFRLRFSSYAYESSDAESTDFVKLFGSDEKPDIAVHLTPALYNPRVPDIPNLAFAVIESTSAATIQPNAM